MKLKSLLSLTGFVLLSTQNLFAETIPFDTFIKKNEGHGYRKTGNMHDFFVSFDRVIL